MKNEIDLNAFVANKIDELLSLDASKVSEKDQYDDTFEEIFKLESRNIDEIKKIAFFVKYQILAINEALIQFNENEEGAKKVANNNLTILNFFTSYIDEVY